MWRFNLFAFPVTVEPWFWVVSFLMGGGIEARGQEAIISVAIWIVVVFVSIVVHELGHALAGRRFGAHPEIGLHGMGGVAIMHGGYFTRWQSIFVSAAGPLASLVLGAAVFALALWRLPQHWVAREALNDLLFVNFFWTAVNLLPILPLDGGQITRDLLGPRRIQIAIWLGVICAVAVGLGAFYMRQTFLGVMMLILAFSNFQNQNIQGGVVKD